MNPGELATQIEVFLLLRGDWVSVEELCQRFAIPERLLRADGKRRPICGRFAISSSMPSAWASRPPVSTTMYGIAPSLP